MKQEKIEYDKRWRENNKDKIRLSSNKYYLKNKETINNKLRNNSKVKQKKKDKIASLSKEEKEKIRIKHKEYRVINKNKIYKQRKEYRKLNCDKIRERKRLYSENKRKIDSLFKLKCNIRSLVKNSFKYKDHKPKSKTTDILGCTFEDFKNYLESKFESWMNWNNHGNWNGYPKELNVAWDIDHITPLSTAKCEDDIVRLNHYTNFQPLCSYTNRHIKSNIITN